MVSISASVEMYCKDPLYISLEYGIIMVTYLCKFNTE